MSNIITEVQKETTRIRNMIAETKAGFPNGNFNFCIIEMLLDEADKAITEQDTVKLIKLLPELQATH